jgi:hypothetical protein
MTGQKETRLPGFTVWQSHSSYIYPRIVTSGNEGVVMRDVFNAAAFRANKNLDGMRR